MISYYSNSIALGNVSHQGRIGAFSAVSVPAGRVAQGGRLVSTRSITPAESSRTKTGTYPQGATLRSGDTFQKSTDDACGSGAYGGRQYLRGSIGWWLNCNSSSSSGSSGGAAVAPTPTPPDPPGPTPATRDKEVAENLIARGVPSAKITWTTVDGVRYIKEIDARSCTLAGDLDVSGLVNLTVLNCGSNELTSLDVSNNTNLTYLSCFDNKLTTLDVSSNTDLTSLNFAYNQLTSLDVSKNTNLIILDCSDNQLTSLNVSSNTKLFTLNCSNNKLTDVEALNAAPSLLIYARDNPSLTTDKVKTDTENVSLVLTSGSYKWSENAWKKIS